MLKENGYQQSIINKIINKITNNHSLSQSQQHTQSTNIQKEEMKITLVEITSQNLQRILRSHKIKSTFYTENNMHKLL